MVETEISNYRITMVLVLYQDLGYLIRFETEIYWKKDFHSFSG